MTVDQYIKAAKELQPKLFEAAQIKLTPEALEDLMRHAFAAGFDHRKRLDESIFGKFFGR